MTRNLYRVQASDPLRVLESTAPVVANARHVTIDHDAIASFVASFGGRKPEPPAWDDHLHYRDDAPGGDERVAGWVFALDALNFCFWSTTATRWQVTWRDKTWNGYWALAAALSRAVDEGCPLWDPAWLRTVTPDQVWHILRPDPGSDDIPLLPLRHRHLVEIGIGLGDETAADLIRTAGGSAIALIEDVLRRFPSFRDICIGPDGFPIHFYKRAQILVADLAGSLEASPLGAFHDRHLLTAFADYKVPQVMRHLGILVYDSEVAERIARRELIPAGSRLELEIRAATIWGCEFIRQHLAAAGSPLTAQEIDWLLWTAGQSLPAATAPYHRTLTPFY
jgi:hypothetical protein